MTTDAPATDRDDSSADGLAVGRNASGGSPWSAAGERGAIVIGGGPAGASTAFALARAGVKVLLLDRAHFPRTKACAEYLSPQSSRILDAMGVLGEVERSGAAQLSGMRLRSPDGTTFSGRFLAEHGYRAFRDRGLALPRATLDQLLLGAARAAGVDVREGWRLQSLAQDPDGRVTGVIGTDAAGRPERVHASVVVGADGLRSVVARRLGLVRRSRHLVRHAIVAHFSGVEGIDDEGEMHIEADGYVGLADVGGGLTNVSLVVPAARLARMHAGADAFLDTWIAGHPHLATRFRGATRVGRTMATGPFASRAHRVWMPGVALVGDAAEFFDPFTGEGVYTALRGGELLAPAVAEAVRAPDAPAADRALAGYARLHDREFRGKRIVERLIALAVAHPWLFDRCAHVLARRRAMADLLVGVAGDFVPPREVLRARFLFDLLRPAPR